MTRSNASYSASDRRSRPTLFCSALDFGGQARRALGLVGEIGMRLYQRETQFGGRAIDHRLHRGEQLVDAGERPLHGRLLGDPRRTFEDIAERGDEIVAAASIEIG